MNIGGKNILLSKVTVCTRPLRRIGVWRCISTHYLTSALHGGEW